MPANNYLPGVLETTEAEHLATGFIFTEGSLWHRRAIGNFVDIRQNKLFRLSPGKEPEVVRNTIGGNGTTFDLQGRLIVCEGDDRRLTRTSAGYLANSGGTRSSPSRYSISTNYRMRR